jgi:hypothetical protein
LSDETFGVLATTRYMLELLIWFRLLHNDPSKYSFIYVKQLITDKRDHAREHLAKVKNEIKLFNDLDKKDDLDINQSNSRSGEELADLIRNNMNEIDRLARRQFCLYGEDAKTRGYGYQAYLIETQVIPKLEAEIEELQKLKGLAISQMPKTAQGHKPWFWKEQAAAAGMSGQFEFVYAYTSRLLHATPTSMTTNQKNLELKEIEMFLDFLYVSILDAIEMSERIAGIVNPSLH